MDELIRELQDKAEYARRVRDLYPPYSEQWHINDAFGQAYDNAASLTAQAKRRMAEREPAWEGSW
jgi:hypothetical protein